MEIAGQKEADTRDHVERKASNKLLPSDSNYIDRTAHPHQPHYEHMAKPTSYCEAVSQMEPTNVHRTYHDTAYGFPIEDDNELFERLMLEVNQAGLSWTTILNKQQHFRRAYHRFNVRKVAKYTGADKRRLLNDAGIIRNILKIEAAIHNARVILDIQREHGSFQNWLDLHHPMAREEWVKLFKQTFTFTGGEIVNEFLVSTGYLGGAHVEECPVYRKVLKLKPAWARAGKISKSNGGCRKERSSQ